MRVLVIDRYCGGYDGPGIYIHEFATGLIKRGHKIALAYGCAKGDHLPVGLQTFHVPNLDNDLWGRKATRRDLENAVDAFAPDIINAHCLDVLWFARAMSRRAPFVASLHTHALTCPNWSRVLERDGSLCDRDLGLACVFHSTVNRCGNPMPHAVLANISRTAMARGFIPFFDAVQALNPYMRKTLERAGIPKERIFDLVSPAPGFQENLAHTPSTRPLVLFVGRLDPTKGPDLLLSACAKLDVEHEIAIVGQGPLEAELPRLANRLGIAHRVRFIPHLARKELTALYREAALLAVPSIWGDPAPLVRIEAMAQARPVIGFDSGGVASCIDDGETGFVVPRGDILALADRIKRVLCDSDLRNRMGQSALAKIRREHHPDVIAERAETIFNGLIAQRRGH